jgi:hypothetical protein
MEGNINSAEDAGIVPRSVNALLQQLESSGAEFTIRVSFLELCEPLSLSLSLSPLSRYLAMSYVCASQSMMFAAIK